MTVAMGLLLGEEFAFNASQTRFRIEERGAGAGATQQVRVNERVRSGGGLSPPIPGSLPHLPQRDGRHFRPERRLEDVDLLVFWLKAVVTV